MSRLIFVPQCPAKMRYQEWWFTELPKRFEKHFDIVITLGKYGGEQSLASSYNPEHFSPMEHATCFENAQIEEYLRLNLRDDDILLHMDLSFPGFFHQVLHHKRPSKAFVFCHATAANSYDYFYKTRKVKFKTEKQQARLYDGIFVGSTYSANKLRYRDKSFKVPIYVVGLPEPIVIKPYDNHPDARDNFIVSVARPCVQKVNKKLEKEVSKRYGKIVRPDEPFQNWDDYSYFLSDSKILLITTKEDTFNYTILDAIKCGCIPIAPNSMCFPEILPRPYLYDTPDELYAIIDKVRNGVLDVPQIRCQKRVNRFYRNMIIRMKGK